jgi:ribosome biogenesis GTPase
MDLGLPERDEDLLKIYRSLGIPVYKINVQNMLAPEGDFAALKAALMGRRSVVTGHSGVGKSSLVLALNPQLDPDVVRTGEVSGQTEKGKHTTTHARLFTLFEGNGEQPTEIVDTPGVREFTPADTDRKNLWGWFPEIVKVQSGCTYADCSHTVEKSCAVLAAVERGEMHPRRHRSYVRMYETLPT